jgi:hypothetical protein
MGSFSMSGISGSNSHVRVHGGQGLQLENGLSQRTQEPRDIVRRVLPAEADPYGASGKPLTRSV